MTVSAIRVSMPGLAQKFADLNKIRPLHMIRRPLPPPPARSSCSALLPRSCAARVHSIWHQSILRLELDFTWYPLAQPLIASVTILTTARFLLTGFCKEVWACYLSRCRGDKIALLIVAKCLIQIRISYKHFAHASIKRFAFVRLRRPCPRGRRKRRCFASLMALRGRLGKIMHGCYCNVFRHTNYHHSYRQKTEYQARLN